MTQAVGGSPGSCARPIETFLRSCGIDRLIIVYDDYNAGLRVTGQDILPYLRAAFA